jgi:hypothetical protein
MVTPCFLVVPFPDYFPPFTRTAPTIGFGDVVPSPLRARDSAIRIYCSSFT